MFLGIVTRGALPYSLADAAVGGIGDFVYLVGGRASTVQSNTLRYDALLDTWSVVAAYPYNVWGAASAVIGNFMYVWGGSGASSDRAIYRFDPDLESWTALADRPVSATGDVQLSQMLTDGTHLYLVGGKDNSVLISANDMYDPSTGTYTSKTSPTTPVWAAGYASASGKGLLVGGSPTFSETRRSGVQAYEFATDTWADEIPYPMVIDRLYACAHHDGIVTAGGQINNDGSGALCDYGTYRYGISDKVWTRLADIPRLDQFHNRARAIQVVSLPNGRVFLMGGEYIDNLTRSFTKWNNDSEYELFSGLTFRRSSDGVYYNDGLGGSWRKLDLGTAVLGHGPGAVVGLILRNHLGFSVKNIELSVSPAAPAPDTVEISRTSSPFTPENPITYAGPVGSNVDIATFYVRVTAPADSPMDFKSFGLVARATP